jgi:hypothetical protein
MSVQELSGEQRWWTRPATAEAAAGDASVAGARVRIGTKREGKRVGEERQRSGRVGVLPRFDWTILGHPDRPIESAQLTSNLFF